MRGVDSLGFTIYDLITSILPGSFLVITIYLVENSQIKMPQELMLFVLLAASFIVGNLLFAMGSLLFYVGFYPEDYKKRRFLYFVVSVIQNMVDIIVRQKYGYKGLEIKKDIDVQIKQKLNLKSLNNQARFQVCDAIVAESGFGEREVLLAKQGFYRSVAALAVVLIPYLAVRINLYIPLIIWLIVFVFIIRLLLHTHTYYGEIRKVQVYALAYMKLKQMK